jgi:putative protein-disulfide isomerase
MESMLLHYVHDPLCGWCYAATPMVEAVESAGLKLKLHGGGLWDQKTRLDINKRNYIRQSDRRIATLAGREFGAPYLDGLLNDDTTVFWSRPTIAAVLNAGALGEGADLAMLHAIQAAHYQRGLHVVDSSVLQHLAVDIGLDGDEFSTAINDIPVDEHIQETRRWMQQFGLGGYPSFVVECEGKYARVAHETFYGSPKSFLQAVSAAALSLKSQRSFY